MNAVPPGAVAVIFTSRRTVVDDDGYAEAAAAMSEMAAQQPGYLGVTSARDPQTGWGITVSYWRDDESARAWKAVAEHLEVQRRGRDEWYSEYSVVVAEVTRAYAHRD